MTLARIFFGVAIVVLLFACSVDAHGWMTNPVPRGQYRSTPKYAHEEYGPTAGNTPDAQEFVCRNDPVMPRANWTTLTAGRSQSITLDFNAIHPGDCFVYLTYDGDKPENQMKWFKIWEQHECYKKNKYEVPIPSYLPTGEHVIFRWEWYALHAFPTVEYYTQCVDAVVRGSSTGALPQPQVNIPGHLPKLVGGFLNRDNNYWWPYDNQAMFFTGPAVASLNGQPNPTETPSTPAPTPKPTTTPTTKPTTPPTPTTKPTTKPTTAPTTTPTTTPTTRPTTAPTTTPTSAPPTAAPTTRPTTPPSSDSVKLTINPSSSDWWFACSISGYDIAKMEIKDSGAFSSFHDMKIEWADVYVFYPQDTALVLPLTVQAYLSSGSSVSFSVTSISASSVESGATFQ